MFWNSTILRLTAQCSLLTTMPLACIATEKFLQTIEDCFYTQHVLTPTRRDSILDLLLTNDPDLVSNVDVVHNFTT